MPADNNLAANSTRSAPPEMNFLQLAVDIGPVLVFIATYVISKNPFTATEVFMVAMVAAIVFAKIRFGAVPVLLILSGIMVIVFGGMTIYLQDKIYIQIKPSIYYAVVAAILFYGGYSQRPVLKHALGYAYPDLSDKGWHLLGRNFAWFFVVLAILNEYIRLHYTFETWAWTKLWLFVPATMIFGGINIPMIMRHSQERPEA